MKIIVYVIYLIIFTACYYGVNRGLSRIKILIAYPLFFVLSIYPIKLITDHLIVKYGKTYASEWLILMLFAVAMFSLFNFFYAVTSSIISTQNNFHNHFNSPNKGPIKFLRANSGALKNGYHLFFYIGGIVLFAIVVYHSKI